MIDDNLENPDKQTGLIQHQPTLPGVIEETVDQKEGQAPDTNPAPVAQQVGAGIAGKLDEKEGDEFEGGNQTNFYDETIDLANYDTNKTSQNLIQKSNDNNFKDDDNVTQVGQNDIQMSNLKQNSQFAEESKTGDNNLLKNQVQFNDSMLDDFNFDDDKLDQIVSAKPKSRERPSEEALKIQNTLASGIIGDAIRNLLS